MKTQARAGQRLIFKINAVFILGTPTRVEITDDNYFGCARCQSNCNLSPVDCKRKWYSWHPIANANIMSSQSSDSPDRIQIFAGSIFFIGCIYGGLLWCGATWLYRPAWIPVGSEEPVTYVFAGITAIIALWYKIFKSARKGVKGIRVHILRAYYRPEVPLSSHIVFAHSLTVSFLVQNLGETDIAIKSVNVSYLNKKDKLDLPHSRMYADNIPSAVPALIALVPAKSSNNIEMNFFASYSKVDEEKRIKTKKLCLGVVFSDGKEIIKSFYTDN